MNEYNQLVCQTDHPVSLMTHNVMILIEFSPQYFFWLHLIVSKLVLKSHGSLAQWIEFDLTSFSLRRSCMHAAFHSCFKPSECLKRGTYQIV